MSEKYKKITLKACTADTKNRERILRNFDSVKDDEIFILCSCKTIGEGVEFELAASWTSFNDLEVKMVNSNIECEGMWKYQLSKDAKGTRIDLVEIVDMHNIGYKAYLTINSHLVDLEDLIDAIDAK